MISRKASAFNIVCRSFHSRVPAALRGRLLGGALRAVATVALMLTGAVAMRAQTSSTTILTVTSGGAAVTSVSTRTAVTLTAAVQSGGASVMPGLVKFCDATAALCEDSHLLGTAQLTSSGTAVYRFVPGVGSHVYKAIFVGTHAVASSTSNTVALTVAGILPSGTSLAASGAASSYTLTATASGNGVAAPTGTVSFSDATFGNTLGTQSLSAAAGSGVSFASLTTPNAPAPENEITADFNGDGILDIAAVALFCPRNTGE